MAVCAEAYYERGLCYQEMQDYKRALYDFSAAIRSEAKTKSGRLPKTKELANYYCKQNFND